MSRQLVLIKFGGSLITDKRQPFTVRPEKLEFLAAELAAARQANPEADFIIGNGAGSFGHFTAHEYGLREGARTAEQYYGMSVTHNGVVRLNTLVAEALTKQHIPAFAVSPAALFTCADKQLDGQHIAPLVNLLRAGCIPVLHGDTITDTVRGTTILSTEKVLQACLEALAASYDQVFVIYLLDIDGVLSGEGVVIPKLSPAAEVQVRHDLQHDVTGGILGKVVSARQATALAKKVYIASGSKTGVIAAALAGQNVGTQVL